MLFFLYVLTGEFVLLLDFLVIIHEQSKTIYVDYILFISRTSMLLDGIIPAGPSSAMLDVACLSGCKSRHRC